MIADSTYLNAGFFGATEPLYPLLPQFARVFGNADSNGVYSAYMQQFNLGPPLAFRDREAVYVWGNGATLNAGVWNVRLVGSYLGLPLLVAVCTACTPAASAVSHASVSAASKASVAPASQASQASGGGGGISTDCCPSNNLPDPVTLVFGGALVLLGTVSVPYDAGASNPGIGLWVWSTHVAAGGVCGEIFAPWNITFECDLGQLFVSVGNPGNTPDQSVSCEIDFSGGWTCSPFSASGSATITSPGTSCGGMTASVTAS